ncbi:MAG TPA: hypothetical protein VHL80_18140 [Polyangia bacterium]|nr:hypothetical protein [Polyangia bacterium]
MPPKRGKRAAKPAKPTKLEELDLPAEEFIKARRQRARDSYEILRPQIEAVVTQLASLTTEIYGKQAVNLVQSLRDPKKSTWEWMTDVVAIGMEDWTAPLEFVMRTISATTVPSLRPSKHLRFELDQASQASDPQEIAVSDRNIVKKISRGSLEAQPLVSKAQTIPSDNVRLSVKGKQVFVSLVDLAKLGRLNPAEFSGAIRVSSRQKAKASPATSALTPTQRKKATKSWLLGTAHTKIAEGPG